MPEAPSHVRRDLVRRLYTSWLPIVLGVTALVNIALTPFLPPGGLPIVAHDDASLTHLVHVEQLSVDSRFGFYLELDDATDGGILVVPDDSFIVPELAEGFADFEVTEREYDPNTPLPADIADRAVIGVAEDEDGNDLPYSIVRGEDDVWWLAYDDGAVVVVPESVAPIPEIVP